MNNQPSGNIYQGTDGVLPADSKSCGICQSPLNIIKNYKITFNKNTNRTARICYSCLLRFPSTAEAAAHLEKNAVYGESGKLVGFRIDEKVRQTMDELQNLADVYSCDFFVSYKTKEGKWQKWKLLSEWHRGYAPNYRQVLPDEIIVESDFDKEENKRIAEIICAILKQRGIFFARYFSGNKSYHIHIFFSKLAALPAPTRTKIKAVLLEKLIGKELADKIDHSNLGAKHLILIPGQIHPKSGQPKVLIDSYNPGEINILPEGDLTNLPEPPPITPKPRVDFIPSLRCRAVELSLKQKFPDATGRQKNLAPNVAACTRNAPNCDELRKKFYEIQNDVSPNCLENWDSKPSQFNCRQLQAYMKKIGEQRICQICLLNGGGFNG